jgi:hypothetical protein
MTIPNTFADRSQAIPLEDLDENFSYFEIRENGIAIAANTPTYVANSGFIQANSSYDHANAAFDHANSGFIQANAAFIRANNSLNANSGGRVTANVVVNANLQVANVHTNTYISFSNTSLVSYNNSGIANGEIEFFNNSLFGTVDTTQGRGFIPVVQYRYLSSNSAYNISTAQLPFMGNANGAILTTDSAYEVEWNLYFLKSTAGTVTFSIRTRDPVGGGAVNPQLINANYQGNRIDVTSTSLFMNAAGRIVSTADPTALPATVSLTGGAQYYFTVKAFIITNAATVGNCYLGIATSAGLVTPNVGSYMKVTKLPSPNTGLWS